MRFEFLKQSGTLKLNSDFDDSQFNPQNSKLSEKPMVVLL